MRGLIQFEVVTAIMVVMLTISVPSSIGNTDAVLAQLLLLHLISILIPSVCGSCRYRLSCCCCCSFMRVYIYIYIYFVSIAMLILFSRLALVIFLRRIDVVTKILLLLVQLEAKHLGRTFLQFGHGCMNACMNERGIDWLDE